MTTNALNISVNSEIGKLKAVLLHTPGAEVQNMTPENAERALYSDILNLRVAQEEYKQFSDLLSTLTNTFQVKDLLKDVLSNSRVRENLILKICENEKALAHRDLLDNLENDILAAQLIEGVVQRKDNLTAFLSRKRYALKPLHNFFFTRDAAISINNKVLIAAMANKVRERESIIMQAIFDFHPAFATSTVNPREESIYDSAINIEGGDILIARKDVLLIGIGSRTSSQGVDYILHRLRERHENMHIIVQELPKTPESFIHLDMVFTILDKDKCMVYEPIITKPNRYQTVHISVTDGEVKIEEEENMLVALKNLGFDLEPIICGGTLDSWNQQREQWHSGANFFAFAPGKVIGYERNIYTIDELNKSGFEVIKAKDVISGKQNPDDYQRCVVCIEGSELSRGGGGARCMTMPVAREEVSD
jgi:arginine deiminase